MNDSERKALVDELAAAMGAGDSLQTEAQRVVYTSCATACLPIIERLLAAADAPSKTLQAEIATCSRDTFGSETDRVMRKLFSEHKELGDAVYARLNQDKVSPEEYYTASVAAEAADVLFMLFQLAENFGFDLIQATRAKFEINKARAWARQPDGTFQHMKDTA